MKNIQFYLAILVLFVSCVNKTPELNEEEYILFQQEYEANKKKSTEQKEQFFAEYKDEIKLKLDLIESLKDSTRTFDVEIKDEDYFLDGLTLTPINNKSIRGSYYREEPSNDESAASINVVFLAVNGNDFAEYKYEEPYNKLYDFDFETSNTSELEVDYNELKQFVDLKYAFISQGYRVMEPTLGADDTFESGMFFGTYVFYDLVNNKPLYSIVTSASNSEEISFTENKYYKRKEIDVIKGDFEMNITTEITKSLKKHFVFK